MTDMIYLDEYGNAVDDGAEIHAAIEKITDMLAAMTKAERMNWFRKTQYPYPINFETEIDGTVYSVNTISTVRQAKAWKKKRNELF